MAFSKNIGRGLITATALAALAAGCANNAQNPPTVVRTQPAPAPANTTVVAPAPAQTAVNPATTPNTDNTNAGPGGPTGNALGDQITREIHTNVQMTGSRITAVSTADGTVRLTGQAQDRQQQALAAKTARDEPGVNHVVDKIQIVPTGGVKEAAAPQKVIVKKYFYIRDNSSPSPSNGFSGPSSSGDTGGMNGSVDNSGASNPKHPTQSTSGPSPDTGVYNDGNSIDGSAGDQNQ